MAEQLSVKINTTELRAIQRVLGDLAKDVIVNIALEEATRLLRTVVEGQTPVYVPQKGQGKETGKLQKSWTEPKKAGKWTFDFFNTQDYAIKLEQGLYPRHMVVETRRDGTPGRLYEGDGGVFSKQAPGGIVGPTLEQDELRTEIAQRIAKQLDAEIKKRLI